MKETAAIPRMPSPTTTATTIRMIFRAPPLFWGAPGAPAAGVKTGAAAAAPGCVVPHLVQNFAPASRVAPQELQNAIGLPRPQVFLHRRRSISQVHISSRVV